MPSGDRHPALWALGRAVRARRTEQELTLHALSERAGVSERFLIQLEAGRGNISVARLCDVAHALDTSAAELLRDGDELGAVRCVVALLGLRGAGKSSIGSALAERLGVHFVELDQLVEHAAGMSLGEVFELGGESFYRRLEREALKRFLGSRVSAVLATGGSLVGDAETFELLRKGSTTIWLKARPEDHMTRVLAQGDERPVKNRRDAMAELRATLGVRAPLYAQADYAVDTSLLGEEGSVDALVEWLGARSTST